MWTEEQLAEDLQNLGLTSGANVLAHTSLRSIGKMADGAQTLVNAFRRVLGPEGTLLVPTFTESVGDPAEWRNPPETPEDLERLRRIAPVFDRDTTPAETHQVGYFPEIVRQQPDALRSDHPLVSFAAIGANAAFLTRTAPFHYPLGSESPLARLHQLDGWTLLLGVGHSVNTSLHMAEIWSNAPYVQRQAMLKTGPEEWTVMRGSPECSDGFPRIEPILHQSRLLKKGYIGNAASQLMRQRPLISLAVTMLQGDSRSLLCSDPRCPWCTVARRFCAPVSSL